MKNWEPEDVNACSSCGGVSHTVGVFARVGHAEKTLAGVLELEVLIRKLVAIDGLAASAVALCEVTSNAVNTGKFLLGIIWCLLTTLDHELLDDAVEGRALVAETLLASSKGTVMRVSS